MKNMNKTQSQLVGKINLLNGVYVEVEAGTVSDLASVISSVVGSSQSGHPKATSQVTKAKGVSTGSYQPVGRKYLNRTGYHKWTEHDVVSIARIAIENGPMAEGVGEKCYKFLKESGDFKGRTRVNVSIFARRIHRYIFTGNRGGIHNNIAEILKKHNLNRSSIKRNTITPQEA